MTRAFYRSYVHDSRRARQVRRLHIMREDGNFPGRSAECGVHGWNVTRSETVVIDPMPAQPPDGLTWCACCVGRLAARTGRLDGWATELAKETSVGDGGTT